MARHRREPALVIVDGGVASALACALLDQPESSVCWLVRRDGPDAARRAQAANAVAAAYGLRVIESAAESDAGDGFALATRLLSACRAAKDAGLPRVVWATHAGDDPAALARAIEHTALVSAISALEGGPDVEAPLADLADAQVADLALDLNAPQAGWWECEKAKAAPCAACSACVRWRTAFESAHAAVAGLFEGVGHDAA